MRVFGLCVILLLWAHQAHAEHAHIQSCYADYNDPHFDPKTPERTLEKQKTTPDLINLISQTLRNHHIDTDTLSIMTCHTIILDSWSNPRFFLKDPVLPIYGVESKDYMNFLARSRLSGSLITNGLIFRESEYRVTMPYFLTQNTTTDYIDLIPLTQTVFITTRINHDHGHTMNAYFLINPKMESDQ